MNQRPATRRLPKPHVLFALLLCFALASTLVAQAAPPVPAAQTQVFLPLVATDGTSISPPPPSGSTSDELIEAAYKAGALDAETALLYRVYAAFGDKRLPAIYRGARRTTTSRAFDDAARVFAKLTPQTQAILREFATPPSAENSWEAQQSVSGLRTAAVDPNRWATTCQTSPNIKVWYHPYNTGDAQAARQICEIVDGTIWPKLVSLIGHGPLPDDTLPQTGGDPRFDIYVVNTESTVVRPLDTCELTPTYMLVNRNFYTRSDLTELLMRAILRGHDVADCDEYEWLFWATTTWAMDYVYPQDQEEQAFAPGYLDEAKLPLNYGYGPADDIFIPQFGNADFVQGVYLWPFYLARVLGDADIVGALWDRSREPDSLAMTNDVIPGGFKQQWPAFSRANWNRDPQREYQVDPLGPELKPLLDEPATLDGGGVKSIMLDGAVTYLSAHAFRFTFPDASVRSVALANRYSAADLKTVHIDALLKIGGQWKREDWTQSQTQLHGLCRDLRAERVEELVLIISNHEFQDRNHTLRGEDSPLLNFTNVACRGWQAEVELKMTVGGSYVTVDETVKSTATFERIRSDFGAWFAESYRVKQGTATWQHNGTFGDCGGSGGGLYPLADPVDSTYTSLQLGQYALDNVGGRWEFSSARRYLVAAGAPGQGEVEVLYRCRTGESFMQPGSHSVWILSYDDGPLHDASSDGTKLEGTFTETSRESQGSVTTSTWTWTMTALPPE